LKIRETNSIRAAFTLVEMLVVIAIIGTLAGLILPAVQMAREAARNSSCRNNLYQITRAILNHETQRQAFPTGGWAPDWLGVPDGGAGAGQPGGWIFNILPFVEEKAVADLVGRTGNPDVDAYVGSASGNGSQGLLTFPIPAFSCPTRRSGLVPLPGGSYHGRNDCTITTATQAARSDYAACGGSRGSCGPLTGYRGIPVTSSGTVAVCHSDDGGKTFTSAGSIAISQLERGAHASHEDDVVTGAGTACGSCGSTDPDLSPNTIHSPPDLSTGRIWAKNSLATKLGAQSDSAIPDVQDGIVYRMSRLQAASIRDGLSNTYLVAEKWVDSTQYFSGLSPGDKKPMMAGYSSSTIRWAFEPPMPDSDGGVHPTAFGSAHAIVWNAAFGDGSVRSLTYSIDPTLHRQLSARADGAGAPPTD